MEEIRIVEKMPDLEKETAITGIVMVSMSEVRRLFIDGSIKVGEIVDVTFSDMEDTMESIEHEKVNYHTLGLISDIRSRAQQYNFPDDYNYEVALESWADEMMYQGVAINVPEDVKNKYWKKIMATLSMVFGIQGEDELVEKIIEVGKECSRGFFLLLNSDMQDINEWWPTRPVSTGLIVRTKASPLSIRDVSAMWVISQRDKQEIQELCRSLREFKQSHI